MTGKYFKFPQYHPTLFWMGQLVNEETRVFMIEDPFAADFLADQAFFNRDTENCCESCSLAIVHNYVHRYEGELVDGIQN